MRMAAGPILSLLLAIGSGLPAPAATVTPLYDFCQLQDCRDGMQPMYTLLRDPDGNLFGTAGRGTHRGEIVELARTDGGYAFRRVHSFCSREKCSDGAWPLGTPVMDVNGNLYGTASGWGAHEEGGIVFKLTPPTRPSGEWKLVKLHDFCSKADCADGKRPSAGLTYVGAETGALYDGVSPLYGTTAMGGAQDEGVAFSLTFVPGRHDPVLRVLHDFCSQPACADGRKPVAALLADAQGNLYGTTEYGGNAVDAGVAFQLAPRGKRFDYTVLHTFCSLAHCQDGRNPLASLIWDRDGGLLGTTVGGIGAGTLFALKPDGANSVETVLYSFCPTSANCSDGAFPYSAVTLDVNGDIVGTTQTGGANLSGGEVYRLHAGSLSVLFSFCQFCIEGARPFGGVVTDPAGHLFGVTSQDGETQGGAVFELVP